MEGSPYLLLCSMIEAGNAILPYEISTISISRSMLSIVLPKRRSEGPYHGARDNTMGRWVYIYIYKSQRRLLGYFGMACAGVVEINARLHSNYIKEQKNPTHVQEFLFLNYPALPNPAFVPTECR